LLLGLWFGLDGLERHGGAVTPQAQKAVSELQTCDGSGEWDVAPLLKHLLEGAVVNGFGYFKLEKNNVPTCTADLDAKFQTDYRFSVEGETVGYLDVERKPSWSNGDWPWPWVNVAKHPMSHWVQNRFNGRPTNKLLSFREKPRASFWLGVRADGRAALPLPAILLFRCGEDYLQPNRYGPDLPVLRVRRSLLHPVFDDPIKLANHLAERVFCNVD
jgi:hypothetical protein